jgi:hypothetical protein
LTMFEGPPQEFEHVEVSDSKKTTGAADISRFKANDEDYGFKGANSSLKQVEWECLVCTWSVTFLY